MPISHPFSALGRSLGNHARTLICNLTRQEKYLINYKSFYSLEHFLLVPLESIGEICKLMTGSEVEGGKGSG
jgi:hypothetical protein